MSINSNPNEECTMMSANEIPDHALAPEVERDTSGDIFILSTDGYGHVYLVDAANGIERFRTRVSLYGNPDEEVTQYDAMIDLLKRARAVDTVLPERPTTPAPAAPLPTIDWSQARD